GVKTAGREPLGGGGYNADKKTVAWTGSVICSRRPAGSGDSSPPCSRAAVTIESVGAHLIAVLF
ncbi:MAG TPA: hypothetical protein VHN13_11010, partial [Candidatus Tectomicrobia bacterium]|nr:hypothetical protein [Candidatus Tectomicrobia bacterium]